LSALQLARMKVKPAMSSKSAFKSVKHLAGAVALSTALLNCSPVVHNIGYVHDEKALSEVVVGSSNKEMVKSIMGSPSTIATVDAGTYYYISGRVETSTYKPPQEVDRKIVAIYFDDNDVVRDIGGYNLEDGNIVAFVERVTPTLGKELTLISQLFGNLGRFNSGNQNALPSR